MDRVIRFETFEAWKTYVNNCMPDAEFRAEVRAKDKTLAMWNPDEQWVLESRSEDRLRGKPQEEETPGS